MFSAGLPALTLKIGNWFVKEIIAMFSRGPWCFQPTVAAGKNSDEVFQGTAETK